jgi:hypothetical protein
MFQDLADGVERVSVPCRKRSLCVGGDDNECTSQVLLSLKAAKLHTRLGKARVFSRNAEYVDPIVPCTLYSTLLLKVRQKERVTDHQATGVANDKPD